MSSPDGLFKLEMVDDPDTVMRNVKEYLEMSRST